MVAANDEKPLSIIGKRAAALFGVSYPTLRRWEKEGWVTSTKIGKQRFYSYAKLEELARNGSPVVQKVG